MPLLLVPEMVFCATINPCASNETIAVVAMLRECIAGDRARRVVQPDARAAAIGDGAIADAEFARLHHVQQPAPRRQLAKLPSSVRPLRLT